MRFYTEEQRLAHPQACLIPSDIFRMSFHNTLSDVHLDLMTTPVEALASRIAVHNTFQIANKVQNWLCIAFSHPGISDDELMRLATEFGISTYTVFAYAAFMGRLNMINLLSAPPADVLALIKYEHYVAFRNAAGGGHLPVMERMIELAPAEVQNMIKHYCYGAFNSAALGGHLHVMERLMALAPAEAQNMIKFNDYNVFCNAASGGHLHVMQRLMDLALPEVNNMIKATDYAAFREAAEEGHLAVMARLIELAPAEVQNMIKARDYYAFHWAAENGHLAVMEKLMELAPAEVQAMIKASDYRAFRQAALGGHSAILERLIGLAPAEIPEMIKALNYQAFALAARGGHLAFMERLVVLAPTEVQNMIKAFGYLAFREAAQEGHIAIVERLIELAPEEVQNMIKADNNAVLRFAAVLGHLPVVNRLLSFPTQMAYADTHEHECGRFTHPYIIEKLASLRSRRQTLEAANPHAVFDIADAEESKCCFYIIRNLIRRNDAALLDDIRFLLDIPSIKLLAHQVLTEGTSNELIRLALRTGNAGAAQILLTIPAVRDLAERNDYYRAEVRGGIDLGALARDRESSIHALSTGEQERLAATTARYQPMMQEAGVGHLFDHLIQELVDRYKANPAKIIIDGVDVVLPADWDAFTHLDLSALQREEALKAYYQHKDHTALRYLSCPNHWMASGASYVYINDAHTQRWSTFEEYKPLIVMLWLAAKDATIAPTDGHTLEGRVSHFIDELAHIGRAHNWDQSRNRVDSSGHAIDEEYDDLAGDKPSCFSGVKRRLFQSVIGHPLLKMLTEEDIHQELRDFVRAHFARVITAENREGFRNALMAYYGSVDLVDAEPLRALNISTEQQALFIQQLTEKYDRQFSGVETRFKSTIEKAFALVENKSNPSDCMHALKFAALANLEQFLPAPVAAAVTSIGSPGFFALPAGQGAGAASATMSARSGI